MMRLTRLPWKTRSRSAVGLCAVALLATLVVAGGAQAATPPTVLLGTADAFALLGGSGLSNVGQSTVSGDVGSSPTHGESGFACPAADCVTLTGANHNDPDPNDMVTQGAKAALTTAYDDAAGRTPTIVLTELGGQTLVGGVYTSALGTFGMTGTLILDGENNADTVFIFQTASTLVTASAASITLTRGAQACNIFWKIGSAATLGSGSTFRGTILAHDDISVDDGVTVDGRLLAGEQASGIGAVTLIHDTVIRPTTCVTQASVDAATQAAAAQAAADKAAADRAAADKAAADKIAADQAAATQVAIAAQAALDKAAVDKATADKVAADLKAAAVKAAADQARARAVKAHRAKVAAAKATRVAKIAAKKAAAAKKARARATALKLSRVRLARIHSGFTG